MSHKIEYINGKIYKIRVIDSFKKSLNILSLEQLKYINYIYIGCTINELKKRFKVHKQNNNKCNSKILFDLFGYKNLEIILIKEYLIQKESINYSLFVYETLYINKCRLNKIKLLNKHVSFSIQYLAKIHYRSNHIEEKKEINKNYYENNKDYFNNYNKNYYENNKNKYNCNICNFNFLCYTYLEQHKQTKLHKIKEYKINNIEYIEKDLYKYYCKYCNFYENTKKIFSKHIKSTYHIKKLEFNGIHNSDDIYKFKYECKPCNFKDDNKKDYNTHLLSKEHRVKFNITNDFLFKCELCKYYQNIEKLFKRHLKSQKHINNKLNTLSEDISKITI